MTHAVGPMQELHLALVLDNVDPEGRGRIQVELQATGMVLWAACLAPSSGNGYGVSALPRLEELVVVGFVSPELPLIMGAIWAGQDSHPQDAQAVQDKYALITPSGAKVIIDDSDGPKIELETPAGQKLTVTDSGGGEIHIERGSETIDLTPATISINSSAKVEVSAAQVNVSAGMVQVDAGMSQFSGVVKCDTLIATSVVSTSYTPGAGNVW